VAAHEQVHFFAGVIRNLTCLITYNEKKGGRGKLKRYRAAGVMMTFVISIIRVTIFDIGVQGD
jgi:hypothetical protein